MSPDPNSSALRVAIVTNVIPTYRQGFFDRLTQRPDIDLTVFCRDSVPGVNVRPIHQRYARHVRLTKGFGLSGERLTWQFLPWRTIAEDFDAVFVGSNPRDVSHAMLATFLRARGKPVALWGQAISFRNNQLRMAVRHAWLRLFPNILVYTDYEVEHLRKLGFSRQHIVGINNGLDQNLIDEAASKWSPASLATWTEQQALAGRTILLSCARLEPKNRFDLVLDALPAIVERRPNTVWCLIGDGIEEDSLRRRAAALGLGEQVRFIGPKYKEDDLAPYFLSASLFVHPSAIGLSLLHAFGYGLPVVTHGVRQKHNPEFAAFTAGETGLTFVENDPRSLAQTILEAMSDLAQLEVMGQRARTIARTLYNTDVMVERFVQLAKRVAAQHCHPPASGASIGHPPASGASIGHPPASGASGGSTVTS